MSTIDTNHRKLKLHIPDLIDLLKQSSDQQKMMDEIMNNIFKHAAIVSVSNSIEGYLNV